jgi:hypothetical protein
MFEVSLTLILPIGATDITRLRLTLLAGRLILSRGGADKAGLGVALLISPIGTSDVTRLGLTLLISSIGTLLKTSLLSAAL